MIFAEIYQYAPSLTNSNYREKLGIPKLIYCYFSMLLNTISCHILSQGAAVGPLLVGPLSTLGWDYVFYVLMIASAMGLLVRIFRTHELNLINIIYFTKIPCHYNEGEKTRKWEL